MDFGTDCLASELPDPLAEAEDELAAEEVLTEKLLPLLIVLIIAVEGLVDGPTDPLTEVTTTTDAAVPVATGKGGVTKLVAVSSLAAELGLMGAASADVGGIELSDGSRAAEVSEEAESDGRSTVEEVALAVPVGITMPEADDSPVSHSFSSDVTYGVRETAAVEVALKTCWVHREGGLSPLARSLLPPPDTELLQDVTSSYLKDISGAIADTPPCSALHGRRRQHEGASLEAPDTSASESSFPLSQLHLCWLDPLPHRKPRFQQPEQQPSSTCMQARKPTSVERTRCQCIRLPA